MVSRAPGCYSGRGQVESRIASRRRARSGNTPRRPGILPERLPVSERAVQGQRLAELVTVTPAGQRRVRSTSVWQRFLRNRLAMGALLILVVLGLVTFLGPLFIPADKVTEQVRG